MPLDCVVIGYNELPFAQYADLIGGYGEDSEAYRDLRCSFVEVGARQYDYPGLMNQAAAEAQRRTLAPDQAIKSGDIPALAAVYLTNYLERRGYHARYVNLFQYEKDALIAQLRENPLAVAITSTLYVLNFPAIEIVEFVRRHNPNVKIVIGGPLIANHARNYPAADGADRADAPGANAALATVLADLGADIYVIEGQGELTLARILDALRAGQSLDAIPNLAYFEHGVLHQTPRVAEANSLDEDAIDWVRVSRQRPLGPTIQTRTARSCAFKCAFCNYPSRAGALSLASLDTIERELDSMREVGGVSQVVFIDDTFNVPIGRFKDLCRMMIRKQYGFQWFSYFRCSNADEEAIDLLAESGCAGVFLGIESGSAPILKNMNKAATPEKYRAGIARLKARGVLTFGSFIVGFPGETDETVQDTIDFIRETGLDYYRAQLWYCEPGTPIFALKDAYRIEGDGFVWTHATMDSLTAMDHIERLLLSITEAEWLPQWSFDFWIIPYLMGRGLTRDQFRAFMVEANQMLKLDLTSLPAEDRERRKQACFSRLVDGARQWSIESAVGAIGGSR
jgi:radical SAM PhpK family P-methyltransferase